MKILKIKCVGISLLMNLLVSIPSFGQANDTYRQKLQEMFELSGTEQSYKAAMGQMFSMFRGQFSNVDADVWNELEGEFSKTSLVDLKEMLLPVYFKYLTEQDLDELIKFYKTDTGKKFAKNTPFIMQESMQIGQQWGMKIGQEFKEKMDKRGR